MCTAKQPLFFFPCSGTVPKDSALWEKRVILTVLLRRLELEKKNCVSIICINIIKK